MVEKTEDAQDKMMGDAITGGDEEIKS